ncbi:TATA box-binding protein-associated factor RNA polymerase I subunit B-like [Gigantopelta aegis]|uniref:TATA box-binding protein-associated factor RNA polymerase I subunit B-like n=1 Tax=Gigantopelta aegis TaxID=1735272 RepID=UPI001B88DD77|nr:TATA box-binding protein-associated factor RNA polymerase I subunit B-like [Gigantopelta aegis]XP_041370466.1 TATA box-binding protein-associated factor RNA polymerase I subunit B-like [Gigantopelta aegis]
MPSCITCGGEDFDVCDGLFYCSMCQTQTQDLRVEMEEASFIEMPSRSLLVKSKKSEKKIKKVEDKGRPWTIYEGYQFVLKAQVRALIMLGADPKIDEVVFRLWALYLSKIEIAFCNDEKLVPVNLEKCARHREIYRGDMENPEVIPKRAIRGAKRASQFCSKSETENQLLKSKLKDEEFYEGDNPAEESENNDDDSSSEEDLKKDGKKQRYKNYVPAYVRRSDWMHLKKNLALCLLGLMFTNNLTTAADLIRWIKEGTLPFIEVTSLLPSDVKFSAFDVHLFKCEFPTVNGLRYETAKMAHFLGLEEFPPFPIEQLISKYILHMDLPGEMHGFVMNLVRQQSPTMIYYTDLKCRYRSKIPPYEAIAMSYIIITIKLWFGLDDHTERCLSTYSRKLTKFMKNHQPLFVFADWKAHMTLKFKQHINQTLLLSDTSTMEDVSDVDEILELYSNKDSAKQRFGIQYSKKSLRKKIYNPDLRKAIKRPFLQLSEKWSQSRSTQEDDQSNDSFYTSREYEDPMDVLNESDGEVNILTHSKAWDGLEKHGPKLQREREDYFRRCTLRHVTHSKEFISGLNLHGLDEHHVSHSTMARSEGSRNDSSAFAAMDVSFENDSSEPETAMNQDIFSLKSSQRSHIGEQSGPLNGDRVQDPLTTDAPPDGSTESEINSVMEDFVNAQDSYVLYNSNPLDKDCVVEYHKCYHWLLTVCGAMIESTVADITECVNNLQSILVTTGALYVGTKQSTCQSFVKKYIHSRRAKLRSSPVVNADLE